MNFQYDFTEKERLLRKEWLLLTIFLYFVLTPFHIAHFVLNSFSTQNTQEFKGLLPVLILCIFYAFFASLYFFVLYKCAYKKPGTRYLTFLLIVTALSILRQLVYLTLSFSILDLCISVVSLLGSSWWYFLSYKMRELNQKIKTLKRRALEPTNLTQ